MQSDGRGVRELEEWLRVSVADAERELPHLIDLPASMLHRELAARPELWTAGMLQVLTAFARDALDRHPRRAHELVTIALELASILEASGDRALVVARLHGLAWKEYARTLCELRRPGEAREALARARRLFGTTPAPHWYLATVDLLEAPLIHEAGDAVSALELVRRAAAEFALHHDYEHLAEARMLEMWMYSEAGDDGAMTQAWTSTVELAAMRRHPRLVAFMISKAARLHLRRGNAEVAEGLLRKALRIFAEEGLRNEATRARWNLAEALTAQGRLHQAIWEFQQVRATLLDTGAIHDAALASTEIIELLLLAGREDEVPTLTESYLETFHTRLTQNALETFTFLHARATSGALTRDDVAAVRRYFEDLRQQPGARFRGPE